MIRVDFACGGDGGHFTGRAPMVHMPDGSLELTAFQWNITNQNTAPRFRVEDGHIILSGKHWPYIASKEWFGNWCWNAYWFALPIARQFLIWLHARRLFQCEGGWCSITNLWDLDEPLDHDLVGLDRYLAEVDGRRGG